MTTTADPLLDPASPSVDWAINVARGFVDGSVSVDQLYRCAHDLIGYRRRVNETMSDEAIEADLMANFVRALEAYCFSAVISDYSEPLEHYVPQWLVHLERGPRAWREAVESGAEPEFVELEHY